MMERERETETETDRDRQRDRQTNRVTIPLAKADEIIAFRSNPFSFQTNMYNIISTRLAIIPISAIHPKVW